MINKEEPVRISTVFNTVAVTGNEQSCDKRVYGSAIELASGEPPAPIIPTPDIKLSTIHSVITVSGSDPELNIKGSCLEVASVSVKAEYHVMGSCVEVCEGEIIPRDMTPSNRISTAHALAVLSGTNPEFHVQGSVLEVASRPDIYSPYTNVQLIY